MSECKHCGQEIIDPAGCTNINCLRYVSIGEQVLYEDKQKISKRVAIKALKHLDYDIELANYYDSHTPQEIMDLVRACGYDSLVELLEAEE